MIAGGGDDGLGLRPRGLMHASCLGFGHFRHRGPIRCHRFLLFNCQGELLCSGFRHWPSDFLSLPATSGGEAWLGFGSFCISFPC
jgi:hypothetical protein